MTTINDINREVAEQLQLPEKLVAQANQAHWEYVRQQLAHPEHSAVYIKWIGTFHTSPAQVVKRIFAYIQRVRRCRAMPERYIYRATLVEAQAREMIGRLWKLKQLKGWRVIGLKSKNYKNWKTHFTHEREI